MLFFKYVFSSFLLFLFPLHMLHFLQLPHSFQIFFYVCFSLFFSLLSSFGGFHCNILNFRVSSLHISPSKVVLISIMFLMSSISFWFFLWISISWFTLSICSYKLSPLFNIAFSILIIVVLNFRSNNSNIPAISAYGSDAFPISSNCVFCLLVCLTIFSW